MLLDLVHYFLKNYFHQWYRLVAFFVLFCDVIVLFCYQSNAEWFLLVCFNSLLKQHFLYNISWSYSFIFSQIPFLLTHFHILYPPLKKKEEIIQKTNKQKKQQQQKRKKTNKKNMESVLCWTTTTGNEVWFDVWLL